MPDKNIKSDMRVLITGNLHDSSDVSAVLKRPPLEREGTVTRAGAYDEEWGQRWFLKIEGRFHEVEVSEQDLSPIPDLAPTKTERGFKVSPFTDLYGSQCSIQESSLATEGALWIGVEEGGHFNMKTSPEDWARYYSNMERATGGRMHLSQGQAAALLPLLHYFVEHGCLP